MKKLVIIFILSAFSLLGLLFVASDNVLAIPNDNPDTSIHDEVNNAATEDTTDESQSEEEASTCYDQLGAISWLVCPVTNTLANGIDWLYSGISDFLVVKTISTDTNSPIYLVWEYARNITNIVFIIFILIIVYSQITGLGLSNYGIKRTLPRIIITAILVNLSFIICALAVDVSNILGGSLHHVFTSIQESVVANSGTTNEFFNNLSVGEITAVLLGTAATGATVTIAGLAIAGGIGAAIWMLLPIILSGFVAVLAAFITVAARQALIMILIMIAPLAFVAYLLPNTEKWFDKWKSLLLQMLIFYPMFSALFGASQLAGWAIISSSTGWLGIVLGIAVQLLPLFMSFSLLRMSGTIPGKINELARKPFAPAQRSLGSLATDRAAMRRAEYTQRGLKKPGFRPLSGAYWAGAMASRKYRANDRRSTAEEASGLLAAERLNAEKRGAHIKGYDKNGKPIYATKASSYITGYDKDGKAIYGREQIVKTNNAMKREFAHRELKLRTQNAATELDNTMGTMGDYLERNNFDTSRGLASQIQALVNNQGENFKRSVTLKNAAARNDMSDKRFYHESVIEAAKDERSQAYKDLIIDGGGADALSADAKIRTDARTTVVAGAYEMFEAERKALTSKYSTFLARQKTKDVLAIYETSLQTKNIDAIVAAHENLGFRGDFDKIGENLQKFMDQDGYVELGSDFANTLASSLLGMKDKDPVLARLGKHINMETWRYFKEEDPDKRRASTVTMDEYITGVDSLGKITRTGGVAKLIEGTSFKGIERTAFGNMESLLANANISTSQRKEIEEKIQTAILPQLISAIPTFETNGEQIMKTLGFITGMDFTQDPNLPKNDPKNEFKWRGDASTVRTGYVTEYLKGFTPNDLINMKTNAFQATMAALELATGSKQAAKAEFKRIQEANGNLKKLRAFEPNILAPMKESILQTLDIPLPPRNTPNNQPS